MDEQLIKMLKAIRAFNPYDLCRKSDDVPSVEKLMVSAEEKLLGMEVWLTDISHTTWS